MRISRLFSFAALLFAAIGLGACGETAQSQQEGGLSGNIKIDGSSTVAPLSEATAELFREENPGVRVSVGTSGTGGGFEKFCRGEIDIADASRQIEDDEKEACEQEGIKYEELTVANDALSVVVNPENDWANCLSVEQLSKIWDRGSNVDNWRDVDPRFPDQEIELFGPGTDSGTFDYFTEAINGEEGQQRTDYNNIGEDDNAVITGVGGNRSAMGYVPLSFVKENPGKVKPVQIRNDQGQCVEPSEETVQNGSYTPLGRALYIYPTDKALQRPEVKAFSDFYIENSDQITELAKFIPLTPEQKQESQQEIERLTQGGGGS